MKLPMWHLGSLIRVNGKENGSYYIIGIYKDYIGV